MFKHLLTLFFIVALAVGTFADEFRTIRPNGILVRSKNPGYAVQTLTAGQTTPNIASGTVIVTGINTGATAIAGFDNAVVGNVITIIGNSATTSNATTIADSGAFKLSAAFTASANKSLTVVVRAAGDYVEIGRGDN